MIMLKRRALLVGALSLAASQAKALVACTDPLPVTDAGTAIKGMKEALTGDTTAECLPYVGMTPLPRLVSASSFTRPADTNLYTFGDLLANSTTAGSVTPLSLAVGLTNGQPGWIRSARLISVGDNTHNYAVTTNYLFRAHFYPTQPTVINGDNGVFAASIPDIGSIDITFDRTYANGSSGLDSAEGVGGPSFGEEIAFIPGGATNSGVNTIYALLEVRAGLTPISGQNFVLQVEVL